jgi:hypothetical protein
MRATPLVEGRKIFEQLISRIAGQFLWNLQDQRIECTDVIGFADAFADVQKPIAVSDGLLVSRAGGGVDGGRAARGDSICIRVGCRSDTDKRD